MDQTLTICRWVDCVLRMASIAGAVFSRAYMILMSRTLDVECFSASHVLVIIGVRATEVVYRPQGVQDRTTIKDDKGVKHFGDNDFMRDARQGSKTIHCQLVELRRRIRPFLPFQAPVPVVPLQSV